MNLLLFAKKLILELNALHTAEPNHAQFVWIQKTVAVLAITFLKRAIAFMHVFMTTSSIMMGFVDHFVMFWIKLGGT